MDISICVVLCIASAVLGRLLLTQEEARRTITVRLPALVAGVLLTTIALSCWLAWGVLCFIGGSFYGLGHWWWPQLFEVLDSDAWPFAVFQPMVTGRWE